MITQDQIADNTEVEDSGEPQINNIQEAKLTESQQGVEYTLPSNNMLYSILKKGAVLHKIQRDPVHFSVSHIFHFSTQIYL